VDTDQDGEIDYTLSLTPDATLFNDTELGLNVGYTMDFIKSQLELAASLPLGDLFPGLDDLTGFSENFSFGPILRLDGDLDVVSADVFESLFDFNTGTAGIEGAFTLAGTAAGGTAVDDSGITVSHVPPQLPVFDAGPAPELAPLSSGKVNGTKADDFIFADATADVIKGRGGNDRIEAGGGRDKVLGGKGDDNLDGQGGKDILKGGAGKDSIDGGKGADKIIGGKGDDSLSGGEGADRFVFAKGHGTDTITDFELGIDVIAFGRGASHEGQLTLSQDGADALVAFRDVEIRIEDVDVKELEANDSFLF
jgi:Ca2+-binding RTX toxin-like protein